MKKKLLLMMSVALVVSVIRAESLKDKCMKGIRIKKLGNSVLRNLTRDLSSGKSLSFSLAEFAIKRLEANPNIKDENEEMLLHKVIGRALSVLGDDDGSCYKFAEFLLKNGASANAESGNKVTPLQRAVPAHRMCLKDERNNVLKVDKKMLETQCKFVKLLLKYGADENTTYPGSEKTPFEMADSYSETLKDIFLQKREKGFYGTLTGDHSIN